MAWTVSRITHEYIQYGKIQKTKDYTEGFITFETEREAKEFAELNCPKDAIKKDWDKPEGPSFISYNNSTTWIDVKTGKEEQGKITYKIQKV